MSSAAFAACGKHSGEGERCSGRYRKVFGFVTGMAFTFASESRSPSDRNAVRLPTGTAFGFDRIHQEVVENTKKTFLQSFVTRFSRLLAADEKDDGTDD